jgi:hypothetical protein
MCTWKYEFGKQNSFQGADRLGLISFSDTYIQTDKRLICKERQGETGSGDIGHQTTVWESVVRRGEGGEKVAEP